MGTLKGPKRNPSTLNFEENMKTTIFISTIFAMLLFSLQLNLNAQQLPYLRNVVSRCVVSLTPSYSVYIYGYTFKNGSDSQGKIKRIEIDVSLDSLREIPSDSGLVFKTSLSKETYYMSFEDMHGTVVPFSFVDFPQYSFTGLGIQKTAGFFGFPY